MATFWCDKVAYFFQVLLDSKGDVDPFAGVCQPMPPDDFHTKLKKATRKDALERIEWILTFVPVTPP